METTKNIFGPFLKTNRVNSNISQITLSEKLTKFGLNIDQSALSRIENGTRELYDYELYCICKILGIDIGLLFKKKLVSKIPKRHNPINRKK